MSFGHVAEVDVDRFGVERLRCVGKITKTLKPAPNTCELSIYNLNADTRAALEEIRPKADSKRGIPVRIRVGYEGEPLNQIWLGDLRTVISLHEPPEWRTILTSGDGEKAVRQSRIAQPLGAKTPIATALKAVAIKLREYLGPDAISDRDLARLQESVKMRGAGQILGSGIVLYGSAAKVLSSLCASAGLEWSIQDGKIQILDRGAALKMQALPVEEGKNLIGLPEVDAEGVIKVRLLIGPDQIPGSILSVSSNRAQGFYRIEKVETEFDTFLGGVWHNTIEGRRIG